jgi:hypothetical protein
MGQYHHLVSIEAEQGLNPRSFGVGLKEGEQAYSYPSTPQAIIALVCARGGNRPADCSQSPMIGNWAGTRVLVVGDYAEDGDIPGWKGPQLSQLYDALTPEEERKPRNDWREVLLFQDIGIAARDFLEAACNVRYFEEEQTCRDMVPGSKTCGQIIDRWTTTERVRVQPVAREFGDSGVAEYVIDPSYSANDLEWLKRCGMRPIDVQRPPRTGDWHGIRPAEIAEGETRLVVNLDTLEYLDPVKFGQVPTIAGMVGDVPRSRSLSYLRKVAKGNEHLVGIAAGLFVMLCHPVRRGGGDIPADAAEMASIDADRKKFARLFAGAEGVKGRWRGNRILGTGDIRYEGWPTTAEVIERGTDISDKVIRYLVAVSHY